MNRKTVHGLVVLIGTMLTAIAALTWVAWWLGGVDTETMLVVNVGVLIWWQFEHGNFHDLQKDHR